MNRRHINRIFRKWNQPNVTITFRQPNNYSIYLDGKIIGSILILYHEHVYIKEKQSKGIADYKFKSHEIQWFLDYIKLRVI